MGNGWQRMSLLKRISEGGLDAFDDDGSGLNTFATACCDRCERCRWYTDGMGHVGGLNATGGRGLMIAAHDKRPRISSARVVAMCSTVRYCYYCLKTRLSDAGRLWDCHACTVLLSRKLWDCYACTEQYGTVQHAKNRAAGPSGGAEEDRMQETTDGWAGERQQPLRDVRLVFYWACEVTCCLRFTL